MEILMLEDSATDVMLTRLALSDAKLQSNLHVVETGDEALEFLHQEGSYTEAPRPDVILLDLNVPRMSGREVLAHIREDKELQYIPVVILSTSRNVQDITWALHAPVHCYINKPVTPEALQELERNITAGMQAGPSAGAVYWV